MIRYSASVLFTLLVLGGCTTVVETNPARTAMEQMLLSSAADRAAAQLSIPLPKAANLWIDSSNFEGTDSKYAIGAIRSHLLQEGWKLVDDKKNADVIIETRAGALSTDRKTFLIGIPSFPLPVPLASTPLSLPEIALYGADEQKGVAKFAITGYDARTGALVGAQEPQYGFSHNTKKTAAIFFTWTDSDAMPEDIEKKNTEEDKKKESLPKAVPHPVPGG